jgi:hypothetical protein
MCTSHPVSSERLRILTKGVLPMSPSMPYTMPGAADDCWSHGSQAAPLPFLFASHLPACSSQRAML